MADAAGAEDATVTFNVRSSGGQKYTLTVPLSITTADLKNKLATEEYANVPASAQRLIYSGKMLKDHEALASYNVKEGDTMHLVKSAASNQRQNPATQSSSTPASPPGSTPQGVAGVPQNLASGTGNDPLAGLTGARYAGFAQLPSASMFQENMTHDDFLRQLDNPHFQQMMREAMGNPQVQEMIINQNPQLRAMGPQARQMLNSDYFRNMMTNPQMIRSMLQIQQMMGSPSGGAGGQEAFPAPGVTNTTEATNNSNQNTPNANPNPNRHPTIPLEDRELDTDALLRAMANPFPSNPGAATGNQAQTGGQQPNQQAFNPFMALFPQGGATPGANTGGNAGGTAPRRAPFDPLNPMLANEQAFQEFMESMRRGDDPTTFGDLLNAFGAPAAPADNRPPEERYAQQLQQLNEMGFYDFDRNVQALRRTGGNVNGAIEYLLNHPTD